MTDSRLTGSRLTGSEIAVIGLAARLPGARNAAEFWRNLREGVEAIQPLTDAELLAAGETPDVLRDSSYVKVQSALGDFDQFDAEFFGFSPQDAAVMDPQHRILLEVGWEAMENAGHDPEMFSGSIGVFATCGMNSYMMRNLLPNRRIMETVGEWLVRHTGNDMNFLATRLSYELNLKGPSMNVQTACSSALVAIHQASQSLLSGECDMAMAGGCTLSFPLRRGYFYKPGEILSPDGHCRPFDARAAGTVFGSGAGMVVLRRLSDALDGGDHIQAVILGSAVNNDGSMKVGYLAPSVEGQAKAVTEALAASGVDPESISFVEAHGTGTHVGDPIEVAALTQAYRRFTRKKGFCALGSVKSNIGHLGEAAGAAGFIKTVLSLKNRQIPPTLHFERPNPEIEFGDSPFFVNTKTVDWTSAGMPRRAGVTALGAGGTNCHVVVEEAPSARPSEASLPWQLLTLSAVNPAALDAATANLAAHLKENRSINLADAAFTLNLGRKAFDHRRTVVCRDVADAIAALESTHRFQTAQREKADPSVAFLFTGQGAQYPKMGWELYQHQREFRETVNECAAILKPELGVDLCQVLYGSSDSESMQRALRETALAQPALFAVEYAMAKLWMSWGVKPQAMLGHSIGEYTAACLAGVFSLEDALALVASRGRLMQAMPLGTMLAVALPEAEVIRHMNGKGASGRLSLAAVNAPSLAVVAGLDDAVSDLKRTLSESGVECQTLHTSHAFHSSMMDPILEPFREKLQRIRLRPPSIPFPSNVTGEWIRAEEATSPEYWVQHLRKPVRFAEGASLLLRNPNQILLEVGPGRTLSSLVRQQPVKPLAALTSMRAAKEDSSDLAVLLDTCGRMWSMGVPIDWKAFWSREARQRVPLPSYPFQRKSYWIEPDEAPIASPAAASPAALRKRADIAEWFYAPCWKRSDLHAEALKDSSPKQSWLVFTDEAGLGDSLIPRLVRSQGARPRRGLRLTATQPGEVDGLKWIPETPQTPGPGEVEIEVRATALNFADVLKVTGAFPEAPFGMELAGVIASVGEGVREWKAGDEVVAIGPESHATRVIRDARFVALKPQGLSFEAAVALPAAYMTAWHALTRIAGLKAGERILIHAASGGVGLAAVEVARRIGAEIFATAGSPEKRAYLESLGIRHVFNSRTTEFADTILERSNGAGVDVVLNSLTGEFIPKSLGVLAAGGRFLEIGKKEIWTREQLAGLRLANGASYIPVDLVRMLRDDPESYGGLLREVIDQVRRGELAPLPHRVFSKNETVDAFRLMLQTRHIGKVVLSLDEEAREVIRVRAGRRFQQLGAAEFVIHPSHEEDYRKLLDALGPAAERIDGIVHLWNITSEGSDKDPLDKQLERGFFSLTGLAKAIGRRELSQAIDLCVVSNRMHDVAGETDIEPAKAALLGPCRVIPREFGNIRCRSIDIDSSGSAWRREMLLEQLASELDSASGDSTVAFRGADRWVQNYEPAPLAPQAASAGLRPTGVYLITGAFGGIGLELARHLAETVQARLVLVGRNEPTADNLEAMRQCAALGAEVLAVKADVADDRQMRRAVKQAQARFGAIHGVFHAAGVLDDGLIQMKEPSAAMRVLAPKVKGSLALDAALRGVQLDFLVLFSSVSSALGLEGQCDYTAANAFLDAFALRKSKRDGIRTQAINWGAWKEVGLAVRASKSRRKDAKTITTKFDRASHWLLAEHAIRGSGAILPGTGYLELARAAFQEGSSAPGGVEIGNVVFQSPFLVPAGESKALSITLTRSASGTEFVFHSSSPEQTHATGTIGHAEALPPAHIDLTAVRHRCDGREEIFDGFLRQNFMDFGPRWGNVRSVRYGSGEALIAMVLPEKFASDLESSPLHPALLDMATGGAQQLIPGFQQDKTFFVPFSYGRLLLRRALPAKLFSHVRLKEGSGPGMATFDVTLADENGSVVAEIADFVMRPAGDLTRVAAADHAGSVVEEGMLNREGFDALARILGSPVGPQIVVSPLDLELWLKQTDAAVKRVLEHSTASGKSLIGGAGGQLEHRLAEMWSGILGVKEIGPRDDFFQLGGHSLLLVRLAARIEREFKKTIPLSFLFESATIEKIAAFLREGAPEDSGFLAPFREEGQGPAFFCVHSVGGDVAGFRNLARLLDPGQKFYGVQLPPELRNPDFPVSVEAMASRYVEEVMAVQAEGPYILGGWSAGAPVALEMAQQLERKGQRVELLVSFDGAPFNTGGETSRWNPLYYGKLLHNVPYWVRDNLYVNFSRSYLSQRISGKLRGLAKKFGARLRGKADFAKYEVRGFLAGLEFSPQALAFMESFYNAVQRYVPHRYAGRVLLYQGRTEPLYHLLEVDRAWNQIAQNLEVVRVKGTHGSLLDDGRVQPIAEHLNQRLRECRNQAATQSCCSMRTVTPISTARSFSS